MSVLKRSQHLQRNVHALFQSERTARETLRESFSVDKLQNEIIDTGVLPHVVKGANARMIELRYQLSFLTESSSQLLSHERRRSNGLESNDSVQFEICCTIHLAHATSGDELLDAKSITDDLPGGSQRRDQHRACRVNSIWWIGMGGLRVVTHEWAYSTPILLET